MCSKSNEDIVSAYKFKDFLNFVEQNTSQKNYSVTYSKDHWCRENFKEALHMARNGVKNTTEIEKIIHTMSLLEHVKTKGFNMSDSGLCVDVGTFLSGDPECFIAECTEFKPKKTIKLIVNTSMAWTYSANQAHHRGAGIMSLVQMLKKQGYNVIIKIYNAVRMYSKKFVFFLDIPSNPLDVQSLSYCLISASFNRRLAFAWREIASKQTSCNDDGYGSSVAIDEVLMSKDIIHFKGIDAESCSYNNQEETKEYIIETCDKFVELNNKRKPALAKIR